jgi:cholesterol oxidase
LFAEYLSQYLQRLYQADAVRSILEVESLEEKAEWTDAVVVGSGFGGSVVAYRLAEAQQSVCLLERGKRYPPGSFPRRPDEIARNFWNPGDGLQGLFDIWSFRHVESVVASGLGGGSLIYANVLIRKDERWFVRDGGPGDGYESWPVTREQLDPHYDRAEKVLGAAHYPVSYAETTPKTRAMRRAASRLGLEWYRPNLAVSFAEAGSMPGSPIDDSEHNLHNAPRMTCRLCGECDIGCNYGSKNTLDYTYLTMAARAGAELRDRCEVLDIAPLTNGFEVGYICPEPQNEGVPVDLTALPRHRLRCRTLVLACGALGTTYLLLRNQRNFPALSPTLGSRFCGNGDPLGFALDCADRLEPSLGPVITSTMRVPDELDGGGRGFYVQDGGYPGFVDWLIESATLPGPVNRFARWAAVRVLQDSTGHRHSEIGAQIEALIGDGHVSAGALPLLGMGREIPNGSVRLNGDYLEVDWRDAMSSEYFKCVEATMAAVTKDRGAQPRRRTDGRRPAQRRRGRPRRSFRPPRVVHRRWLRHARAGRPEPVTNDRRTRRSILQSDPGTAYSRELTAP